MVAWLGRSLVVESLQKHYFFGGIAAGSFALAGVGIACILAYGVKESIHRHDELEKGQEEIREAYKEAYKYAVEENEKLKPQLEEIKRLM